MDRAKETEHRLSSAEGILDEVTERLANAQAVLSSIVGLGNEYKTISKLREQIKAVRYSLERRRQGDICDIDETTVSILEQQEKRTAPKGRSSKGSSRPPGAQSRGRISPKRLG